MGESDPAVELGVAGQLPFEARHADQDDADVSVVEVVADHLQGCGLQSVRLKTNALEQLRDFCHRNDVGLILIGMPGFERQLARYSQLYSRIGFAHQYRPIDPEDVPTVLAHYWEVLGRTYNPAETVDTESANAITAITGGNFRLIERLMTQIARVMAINELDTIASCEQPSTNICDETSSASYSLRTIFINSLWRSAL